MSELAGARGAVLLQFLHGSIDNYLDHNASSDAVQLMEVVLEEFLALWYRDDFPTPQQYAELMATRFCVSVQQQMENPAAARAAAGDILRSAEVDISGLNTQFTFWACRLKKVRDYGKKLKLIGNRNDVTLEVEEKVCRLMEILKDGRDSLVSTMLGMRKLNTNCVQDPLPPEYDTTTTLTKDVQSGNTSFQNLILFVLDLLRQQRLRKRGNLCYRELFTRSNRPMHAWEEVMTIKEFIYQNITKERDYTQWKNLTNPRDNDRHIVDNIREAEHPEFPQLHPKRTLFAFGDDADGGLYSLEEDVFFPYALQETWKEYAESICAHRRRINPSFHVEPPQRHDVAIKHFPESFLPAWASQGFDEADDDPMDLPTPNVDRIFTDQLLQPETMRWIYALLGRLLYETGTHDQWQVLLFFKGIAGSGKSTLAKIMRHVYPPSLVASLSSNVEPRFGLAPLYDKFLVICAEVKRDFGMNQGDLQSAVSGEEVSVAIKNKEAITVEWKTPFLFCGNELAAWKDAAGSMKRRLVVIEFNELIRPDPRLFSFIQQEFPVFLRKINLCYLQKAGMHADSDLWKEGVMPEQIHGFAKKMRDEVDLFAGFLSSSCFKIDISNAVDTYIPMQHLRDMYAQWLRENGYPAVAWRSEVWSNAFKEKGIHKSGREARFFQGRQITDEFAFGITLNDAEEE